MPCQHCLMDREKQTIMLHCTCRPAVLIGRICLPVSIGPPSSLVVACQTVHPLIVAGHGGESVWEDCQGQDLASPSETPCGHALACIHVFIGHRMGGVWTLPCCSCSLDARGHSNLLLRGVFRHSQAAWQCGPRLHRQRREVSESGAPRSQRNE